MHRNTPNGAGPYRRDPSGESSNGTELKDRAAQPGFLSKESIGQTVVAAVPGNPRGHNNLVDALRNLRLCFIPIPK